MGATKARIDLPAQPDDCRQKEEHAAITEGAEARTVLRRERAALDRQNARSDRCWTFNEDVRTRFAAIPK
jgi:hypothetical protein